MATRCETVLLTGFGPFPGVPDNASGLLVSKLAERARQVFLATTVEAALLPTEWEGGAARLRLLLHEVRPDVCIHFGVSRRARGFEIEATARNVVGRATDAAGVVGSGTSLCAGAPEAIAATLPLGRIMARLRRRGLPAYLSRDAGAYLCNAVMYLSLEAARDTNGATRAGFIHIPAGLARRSMQSWRSASKCPLDWNTALLGGLEIVAACLGRPPAERPDRRGSAPRPW